MLAAIAVALFLAAVALLALLLRRRRADIRKRKGRAARPDERATPKQMGMLRALSRKLGVNLRTTCKQRMNCWPDQLTKRTASDLIGILKVMEESGQAQPATDGPASGPADDDATPKQKGLIRALCRELALDADQHANSMHGKPLDSLSKREASKLIDGLRAVQTQDEISYAT